MAAASNARLAKRKANKKLSKAKKQLQKTNKKIDKVAKQAEAKGTAALYEGQGKGVEAIQQGTETARADIGAGKEEGIGHIQTALDTGRGDIDTGAQGAMGQYQNALDLYQPLAAAAGQGAEKYGNFYGLGGEAGYDQAKADWQNSVQYDAMVGAGSMGQQALDRQAAARGNPYNATDTLKYQGDLANQHVGDYIGGLRPYLDQQGQYAGAQANIYGNMADTLYGAGGAKANLTGQLGGAMGQMAYGAGNNMGDTSFRGGLGQSGIYTGTAGNISDLAQGLAGTRANAGTQLGVAGANMTQQQGQNEAAMYANLQAAQNAKDANNANMWGSILGAAGTLGGAYLGKPPV
jgi:hypothetical protein